MSNDTYRMDLTRPIEAHGETHHELVLKDPDCGALEGFELSLGRKGVTIEFASLLPIIASAAGIPPSSATQIRMHDLFRHAPALLDFFGINTQQTGGM